MKLELELDEIGCGRVVIDGVDISNQVFGVTVRCRVGQVSRVRLDYHPVHGRLVAPIEIPALGPDQLLVTR